MASNIDEQLGEASNEEMEVVLTPPKPSDYLHKTNLSKLELSARNAYLDIKEEMDKIPEGKRKFEQPLSIYYSERSSDKYIRVQVRNSRHRDLYSGEYLRLFEAAAFAQLLGNNLIEKGNYRCKVTHEIVR